MRPIDTQRYRVQPASQLRLKDWLTRSDHDAHNTPSWCDAHMKSLGEQLDKLQNRLHATQSRGLLVVLQGMDTSGKDGVIRKVFTHTSPLGVRAEAFGVPSVLEASHDFLWRIHTKVPRRGEMVIFNRSHYEDVLVPAIRGTLDRQACEARYRHINHFEAMLIDEGIDIVKIFLHISKDEQKNRLLARLDDSSKHWKLQESDFTDRKRWDAFQAVYENVIAATSTDLAPWHVIPADVKPWRDVAVGSLIVSRLDAMQLDLPQCTLDLGKLRKTL